MNTIERRLKRIVMAKFGAAESRVRPETRYLSDLRADSLDAVELVMLIEDEFGVELADEEIATMRTVGDTLNLLTRAVADQRVLAGDLTTSRQAAR